MRYLCLILIGFIISPAVARECPAGIGTPLTGNDGVSKYCQSKVKMNWWSAFAWCQSIGGEVIDLTDECIKPGQNNAVAACPNLTGIGSGTVWVRNVDTAKTAYSIQLSDGAIFAASYGDWAQRTHRNPALCVNF